MSEGWHYEQNVRINRLAHDMVAHFTPGHDVEQTIEYEAIRRNYLRQTLIKGWHDTGYIPPPDHIVG